MRIICVALSLVLGLFASSILADDVAKDLKKLEGTWTFDSVEAGGNKLPAEQFKTMSVTMEGTKYSVKLNDMVVEAATQKIDSSKSPKTMDVTVTEGPNKGKVYLAIYEINGDTLKVCFDPEGKKRPTEFKGDVGSQTLVVHKRVKN
jgi:uncharacterized protein (TIGR03067 family)